MNILKDVIIPMTSKNEFKLEGIGDVSSLKIELYIIDNFNNETIKLLSNSSLQFKYSKIEFKTDINENNIKSNLGKIDKNKDDITKITNSIILKNIYFTDFESKIDETIVRELLHFEIGVDSIRLTDLHKVSMKYYFKKDDIIEIDCKLLLSHTTYEYANNISLFYGLYEGNEVNSVKLLFREIRRYGEFSVNVAKNRVVAYTKLCYKVKYDMDDILFYIQIGAPNLKKMNLILSQIILEGGFNYISIKHYGK